VIGVGVGEADSFPYKKPRQKAGVREDRTRNLLRRALANLLFVGSPDCVLPDASGKFFAHF
jgi:hypothetical protein